MKRSSIKIRHFNVGIFSCILIIILASPIVKRRPLFSLCSFYYLLVIMVYLQLGSINSIVTLLKSSNLSMKCERWSYSCL